MKNYPIQALGTVTSFMFAQQPSRVADVTTKVANFCKKYWLWIALAIVVGSIVSGAVLYLADRCQKNSVSTQ